MTRNEAITRLLTLSTQLEADGKDMSAMACTYAAAQLMLLPNHGEGDEIGRAAREAQDRLTREFDRVQARIDQVHREFAKIIQVQFPQHPSGQAPA